MAPAKDSRQRPIRKVFSGMATATLLSEAISDCLALRQPRLAPSTYADEAATMRRLLAHVGDLQCRNLRPEHVEGFMVSLLRPHQDLRGNVRPALSPGSWNLVRHRLMPLQKYLSRRQLTRHDLLQGCEPMRVPTKVRTQAGADTLLAMVEGCVDPRERALLALSVGTALRSSSLKLLRVGDLDLAAGVLTAFAPKTGETLLLPITLDLDSEMRTWLVTYAEAIGRPLTGDDYLVPAVTAPLIAWRTLEDGTKERYHQPGEYVPDRQAGQTHQVIQRALKRVGLPTKGQGAHTVRRSVARLLFDRLNEDRGFDGSLRVVGALLGHSDIRVTQTYIGVSADKASLDAALRGRSLLRPDTSNVVPLRSVRV